MSSAEGVITRTIAGPEAAELLRKAEAADSPYHSLFTWDDSEAARLYRLMEAQWWTCAWGAEHGEGKDA